MELVILQMFDIHKQSYSATDSSFKLVNKAFKCEMNGFLRL